MMIPSAPPPPQNDLRSYAIKYWLKHYKLIPENLRPTVRALQFCENTAAIWLWAEAYWILWNPVSRTDRVFLSMLPVLAGLGIRDLVAIALGATSKLPRSLYLKTERWHWWRRSGMHMSML
jgi:hypothetical protein